MVSTLSDQGIHEVPYISQPWLSRALLARCDACRASQLVYAAQSRAVGVTRSIRSLRGGGAGPNERKEYCKYGDALKRGGASGLTISLPRHHRVSPSSS